MFVVSLSCENQMSLKCQFVQVRFVRNSLKTDVFLGYETLIYALGQ